MLSIMAACVVCSFGSFGRAILKQVRVKDNNTVNRLRTAL